MSTAENVEHMPGKRKQRAQRPKGSGASHSKCSVELSKILDDRRSPIGEKLRKEIPRWLLSRLRHGLQLPSLPEAVRLKKISRGKLSLDGWTIGAPPPEPCESCGRG